MKSMHMVDGGRAEERFFFHGNHLSSVTWVSDGMGVAWQHLQYEPYGGGWVDERTDEARSKGFSSRYRFTGKERDAESGLDYFGARYYWSGGGLWLSVDPLADRYPFLSPYVYGACNPEVLVDADGKDIYYINEQGYVVRQEENNEIDVFHIVRVKEDNTYDVLASKIFDKKIVSEYKPYEVVNEKTVNKVYDLTVFLINDGNEGVELFKFLSDNITGKNGIEFGLFREGRERGIVFTTHMEDKIGWGEVYNKHVIHKKLTEFMHSEKGFSRLSDEDKQSKDELLRMQTKNKGKIPLFLIYDVKSGNIKEVTPWNEVIDY